jgi:hypothetical protein
MAGGLAEVIRDYLNRNYGPLPGSDDPDEFEPWMPEPFKYIEDLLEKNSNACSINK